MIAKILLISLIAGALRSGKVTADVKTCLLPLLCNPTSVQVCTAGCADMCPVATALHPPACVPHFDDQDRPIGVDCVCPEACLDPLTTTPLPRTWLADMAGLAVTCGVQEITNTSYNCPTHSYHVEWNYGDATGCPNYTY